MIISDYYELWDELHECDREEEDGYELNFSPKDVDVYKLNKRWWIRVAEYHVPVVYCLFCGEKLC